ncbi:hypothetical protein BZA77DRAFT_349947 [Pyronema omphalodes]|nr:hypothetical protein BZA77DRAFT_349947 [Pyronema omphalodes]
MSESSNDITMVDQPGADNSNGDVVQSKLVEADHHANGTPDLVVKEKSCVSDESMDQDDPSGSEESDQEAVSDCDDGSDQEEVSGCDDGSDQEEVSDCSDGSDEEELSDFDDGSDEKVSVHDNSSDDDDSSDDFDPSGEDREDHYELGDGPDFFMGDVPYDQASFAYRKKVLKNKKKADKITLVGDEVIPEYRDVKYPGIFNPDNDTYVSRTFAPGTPRERTEYYLIKKSLPDYETEEEFHKAMARMLGLGNWVRNAGAGPFMRVQSVPYAARYAQWITIDPDSEELAPAPNSRR